MYQRRRFGPLFNFSAMSFESANRLMRSTATGTHSFCSLICSRYVQKQRLLSVDIESDSLGALAKHLTGQEDFPAEAKNAKDSLVTPFLVKAQGRHPDAEFLSRTTFNSVFFLHPTSAVLQGQTALLSICQTAKTSLDRCSFLWLTICWVKPLLTFVYTLT